MPGLTKIIVLVLELFLFDVLDTEMDFSKYKMPVLPDDIRIGSKLKAKLDAYLSGGTLAGKAAIEIIDELLPLHDIQVSLALPEKVEGVQCVPDGADLEFHQENGRIEFILPKLCCHQMVELQY